MEPCNWSSACPFGNTEFASRFDAAAGLAQAADTELLRLPDGTAVTIRPIRATDLALETAFVRGLSRESRYARLMSARKLSQADLVRLTDVDGTHEFALIATIGTGTATRQIGVARYVLGEVGVPAGDGLSGEDGVQAEFAIVIADAWQHVGLGEKLLRNLLAAAGSRGVQVVTGMTLATNRRLIELSRKLGFTLHADPADATMLYLSKTLAPVTVLS